MKVYILLISFLISLASLKEENYYKILGVKRNATKKEIKKAYKKLTKKYHPDISELEDANERFNEISEAYEALKDDENRRIYDMHGKEGLKEKEKRAAQPRGRGGFGGIFGDFFGGGDEEAGEEQGEPLNIPLLVSLEDIYNGRKLEIIVTKKSICNHCRGSGAEDPDDVRTCDQCKGRGVYIKRVQVAPGFIQQMQGTCPKCGGKGKIINNKCSVCHGTKVLDDLETYNVTIDKGVKYEEKIILGNSAGDYIDKSPSDLVFIVKEMKHTFYKRKGENDLEAEIRLNLKEALLGFEKKIKHLDGSFFDFKIEGITQPDKIVKIERKGLPKSSYGVDKGDLYIKCIVNMPEVVTDKQKKLFMKFFDSS